MSKEALRLFNFPGNIKFSIRSGAVDSKLQHDDLVAISEYFARTNLVSDLDSFAALIEQRNILLPEMVFRIKNVELVLLSRITSSTATEKLDSSANSDNTKNLPWYKRFWKVLTRKIP